MKLALRQCLATVDINILGVGGKIIAFAFFREGENFLEVVSGLFCLVCDRNFSFHNAVILKFAAKLQHESANVWHSRKEKEIFHKNLLFPITGLKIGYQILIFTICRDWAQQGLRINNAEFGYVLQRWDIIIYNCRF